MPSLSYYCARKLPPATAGAEPDNSIQRHQLAAIANPRISLAELCRGSSAAEFNARPLSLWAKDASIARRLNDSLASSPREDA